jgi:murein DD-endopeptidase MepM/ murein hydrolase activator NlpD
MKAQENRTKMHAFSITATLAGVLLLSVAAMVAFPGFIPKTSASPATLLRQADLIQSQVIETIEKLDQPYAIVQLSSQLRNFFTIEIKPAVASKPATKPVVANTSKLKTPTPKPAGATTSSKPSPTTKTPAKPTATTQAKPAPKPVVKQTPAPAQPKPPVAAKKTEKKTILTQVDEAIPITALPSRPADANYGIPENWPMDSPVSAPYGYLPERGRFHAGVDLEAPLGTPIEAAGAGKVIRAEWYAGYGLCVDIEHANGYITRYGHFTEIYVKKGQWVSAGDWIGANGSTGNSTCPHLHFEVYKNGSSVNPEGISWTMRKMPPKAY